MMYINKSCDRTSVSGLRFDCRLYFLSDITAEKKNNRADGRTHRAMESLDVLCEVTICTCSAGARYNSKQKSIIPCSSGAKWCVARTQSLATNGKIVTRTEYDDGGHWVSGPLAQRFATLLIRMLFFSLLRIAVFVFVFLHDDTTSRCLVMHSRKNSS